MQNMKILATFIILLLGFNALAQTEEWLVPEDKAKELSPFKFTDENVALGKTLYETNCMSCHGNPGQGDYITLVPSPGDPASAKFQGNSDGAIHYKLVNGRGPMPSFKNILSSADMWNIIAYLRSYNPDYAQEVAKKIIEGTFGIEDMKILLTYLKEEKKIRAVVEGIKDGAKTPVENAEVNLFAKRYFGNLTIDEPKRTNAEGVALFNAPTDLPGDTSGNVDLFARLPNESLYGTVETNTTLNFGEPTTPVSLRAGRAMWNTVWNAPIWLLITYFSVVIIIWSFIFYIVLQIRKIFLLGKNN